jgi:hypothetical protein
MCELVHRLLALITPPNDEMQLHFQHVLAVLGPEGLLTGSGDLRESD